MPALICPGLIGTVMLFALFTYRISSSILGWTSEVHRNEHFWQLHLWELSLPWWADVSFEVCWHAHNNSSWTGTKPTNSPQQNSGASITYMYCILSNWASSGSKLLEYHELFRRKAVPTVSRESTILWTMLAHKVHVFNPAVDVVDIRMSVGHGL